MSSNKFLQRFQGKIHIVGKGGIVGLFGDKESNVTVYTNNNFYQTNKYKTATSLNKVKHAIVANQPKTSLKTIPSCAQNVEKPTALKMPSIHSKQSQRHSYLQQGSNDKGEEQGRREWAQEKDGQEQGREAKRRTAYNSSRSFEKRKEHGGLGANIGGQQWMLRKGKMDKMQQFSEQVKLTNARPKLPKCKKTSFTTDALQQAPQGLPT